VVPFILEHHERFDGRGYPRGLKGSQIAKEGRILAVADTFDAMTTDRPYRKALAARVAMDELLRVAGTQLDPEMVTAFEKAWRAGKIK
jgi:HD-GYP domain-containing protein (c-di-GMP phosphodiesterase class II)